MQPHKPYRIWRLTPSPGVVKNCWNNNRKTTTLVMVTPQLSPFEREAGCGGPQRKEPLPHFAIGRGYG